MKSESDKSPDKQRFLQELKQRMLQHEYSLQSIHSKFPGLHFEAPVFVKQLADNHLEYLMFSAGMKNALQNLYGWEYCWVSILLPEVNGNVGFVDIKPTTDDGLNFHARAVAYLSGNPYCPFSEFYACNYTHKLHLELRKIERVEDTKVFVSPPLPAGTIVEFKVYHPRVESLTVLNRSISKQ